MGQARIEMVVKTFIASTMHRAWPTSTWLPSVTIGVDPGPLD